MLVLLTSGRGQACTFNVVNVVVVQKNHDKENNIEFRHSFFFV